MAKSRKQCFEPNVCVFRYLFKLINVADDAGWVKIAHRILAYSCFVSGTNPDTFPDWKKVWFYVYLHGEESWANFFRSYFLKSADRSLRDLKLGIDDDAATQTITTYNMHHCALILAGGNLQALGLCDLGPEGISFSLASLIILHLTSYY